MSALVGVAEEEFGRRWVAPSLPDGPLADAYRPSAFGRPGQAEVAERHEFARRVLRPRPGAAGVLARLRRRGVKLAVLSVCSEEVPARWPQTELAGLFDAETFSVECGLMKPEPEIYLRTARALDVEPAECFFVGDGERRARRRPASRDDPVLSSPTAPRRLGGRSEGGRAYESDRWRSAGAVLITTMNDIRGTRSTRCTARLA
jgi:hypothetical protein